MIDDAIIQLTWGVMRRLAIAGTVLGVLCGLLLVFWVATPQSTVERTQFIFGALMVLTFILLVFTYKKQDAWRERLRPLPNPDPATPNIRASESIGYAIGLAISGATVAGALFQGMTLLALIVQNGWTTMDDGGLGALLNDNVFSMTNFLVLNSAALTAAVIVIVQARRSFHDTAQPFEA